MAISKLLSQALEKYGPECPTAVLSADQPTGQAPMELFVVDEQTENWLSLKTGDETSRGMLTGVLALGALPCLVMALWFFLQGEVKGGWNGLIVAIPLLLIPYLWETRRPLPLPILFNRRTREIFFDHNGELYHTPWDGITAVACEFLMVGPYTGGMRNASLEIAVHRLGEPDNQLFLSLGLPTGKSLEMQQGFWEYLRSYMNNGPWFDKDGNHSESDAFVKSQLQVQDRPSQNLKYWRGRIAEERENAGGKNYLEAGHVFMVAYEIFMYPSSVIQEFTHNVAKRRSRNRWPQIVLERLRVGGPTTRLIDLERERGLSV